MVQMDRLKAGGFSSQAAIALLLIQLQRLLRLRAAMDGGMGFAEAARKLRPPLHFRQERAADAQCRTWTASTLMDAIDRTLAAMRETRLNPALENILAERLLLDVAAIAGAATGAPRAAQR
jgi:DNA polymerase-3 subunit delta